MPNHRITQLTVGLILVLIVSLLQPQQVESAPLAVATPFAGLSVPANVFLGTDFSLTVTFDNTGDEVGFGPYLDLFLPYSGADGLTPVGMNPGTVDGVSFISANYLGANVTTQVLDCPAGGSATHPLTRLVVNCPSQPAGLYAPFTWQMVVITLPFGSFVPTQPPAPITVQARLSQLADLNASLPLVAFGGFMFGRDALDNPAVDPPLRQGTPTNALVNPSLFTVAKTYNGPENETATGPNFPRQYTLSAQIAPGQTLDNFLFEDVIPDNMQFVRVVSSSPAATCLQPSTTQPGGVLSCNFGSVSGTVSLTFEFYIPLNHLNGSKVIDPVSGDDEESCNQARASATWDPIDERDLPETFNVDPSGCEHRLEDKSIAIQKGVSVVGGGEPAPGARLRYTLSIQVSDFFVFDNLVITDVISDGQRLKLSPPPTLQVNGNQYNLSTAPFASSNYSVECDYSGGVDPECTIDSGSPPNSGTTILTFDLSAEIGDRNGGDGRLVGGCVPTGGTTTGDPDCNVYNDGGTTATIVFETEIQEEFSDDFPSGDESVDQGDLLTNTVEVAGDLLSTLNAFTPTGESEADTSGASVVIRQGQISKAVHAINGNTGFATPVRVSPDDVVTYRLRYTLITSDFEDLVITDFLPLPVFRAVEVTGLNNPALPTDCGAGGVPPAGKYCLGSGDTYHALPGAITPTLETNAPGNWLRWTYGDYDSLQNQPSQIEILFSVTVTDDPFADGLFLTNQAQGAEGSTNTDGTDSTSIIQIQIQEPVLGIRKGVVWSNSSNAVFSPAVVAPVTFDGAAATCAARLGGLVNSSGLASSPVNSNLSGVDAGDLALMAVVVENTGRHSAFDVRIADSLPAGLTVVPGSLCITDGSGDPIAASGDLFSGGVTLIDPGPTDPPAGALDPGITGDGTVIDDGRNIAIITYLVQLNSSLAVGSTVTNTASITAYAGSEGGQNHLSAPRSDDAQIRLAVPVLAKTLVGTEINDAVNANNEAVIGELVTYELTITLPEGVTPAAQIVDTLDTGLAFVDCLSINASADLSTDLSGGFAAACSDPVNPTISAGGGTVTFNLGNISNANINNSIAERLVIRYSAVVLNIASNQTGSQLNNSARLSWSGDSTTAAAENITVIEPLLDAAKSVSPLSTDAGNTVTYTITLSHAGGSGADAFDVTLSDPLPLCTTGGSSAILNPTISSVIDSAAIIDSSYFELIGSNGAGWTLQTRTPPAPFDFPYSNTRTITIGLSGSLAYCVTPGQGLVNTVTTRWSSLDGTVVDRSAYNTDSDERTGAGGVNDYLDTGSATLTVTSATPSKYLVATSEAHTGAVSGTQRLAVGEIIRYRVVAQIPEGTIPNFQISDLLPIGLTFLNDNTTRYAFVSDGVGITSSAIGIVPALTNSDCFISGTSADGSTPAIPATCTLSDNHIGSTADTGVNTDSYTTGTDPFFKFGSLTNDDNDDDAEYVVVEFNAIADNTVTGSNDAGDPRDNQARVLVNGVQSGANSNTVQVVIAEPQLSLAKTGSIGASRDAGDSLSYTLTITAASGVNRSTAFDLSVRDVLDAFLTPGTVTITTDQPATCVGNGAGTIVFDAPYSWSSNTLTVTPTCLDPGRTITIGIAATLNADVPAGYVLPNAGSVRWTSLPGTGSTSNPTGSNTPGGSGAGNGERDGSQYNIDTGAVTGINDHGARGTFNLTLSAPQISKQAPPANGYPIGATVTYPLRITLPEGVTRTVRVVDAVPNGMLFVGYSLDTSGYNGSVSAPTVTPATPGDGDDITFNFGNITTVNDNDTGNNAFTLNVTLRVLDVSANQIGATLTNSASLIYTPGTGSSDTTIPGGSRNITVVEPRIATIKDVTPTSGVQAGDVVTYTVRFTNAGTATAFEVTAEDILAQGVSYNNDSVCVFSPDGVAAPLPIPVAVTTGTGTLLFDGDPAGSWDIPVNGYIECTYSATAQDSLYLHGSHTNTVDADWTSLDGNDANERIYQDLVARTVDGTQDTDTALFTSPAPLFAKSDNATSEVVIGQVINYTLTLQSPNGTLRNLQASDTLPAGLVYVDASQSVSSGILPAPVFTVSSPNDGSQAVVLIWQFGDAVISSSPVTITFQARVANVVGNQDGQTRNNQASLTYTDANGVPRQLNAADDVVIREPVLEIDKTVNDSTPPPNGTVTYTLTIQHAATSTADAYDVTLADLIPTGLMYVDGSLSHTSGLAPSSLSAVAPNISAGWTAFPRGSTSVLTYQVTVPFPSAGDIYTNTVNIDWTSLPGTDASERTGSGGINDYNASDSASLTSTAPDLSILKSDGGVSAQPGDVIVYTLTYQNSGNGSAFNVEVSETVPAHTRFVAASSTAGWSCADNAPAGTSCTYTVGSLASGAGGTLQFAVQVDNPLPSGVSQVENTTVIADDGSRGPDPTPENNTASDTTPLTAAPDLTISKDDGVSQAQPGDLLVYVLSYSNTGNQEASGVVVSETVPAHTRFVAASSTAGWSCADNAPAGTSCTYTVGSLASGAGGTLQFAVQVDNPLPSGVEQISNTVTIADDGSNGDDPTPENNTDTDTDTLDAAPDLTISKDDGVSQAQPGDLLVYGLSYSNTGNQEASGVVVSETVPAHTRFVAASSTAGWSCADNAPAGTSCTYTVGSLASGAGGTLQFAVQVDNPLPSGVEQISNTVTIADDGSNGDDPTPENNTDTDTDTLDAAPDLSISKDDGVSQVAPGTSLTYTLQIVNSGNQTASGVLVTDTIPAGTTFVSASDGGVYDAGSRQVNWPLFDLAAGAPAVRFTLTVTVDNPLDSSVTSIINTAVVRDDGSNGSDPTPENNSSTDEDLLGSAGKAIIASNQAHTALPAVAVGEILTYEVRLQVEGLLEMENVLFDDLLDRGLAFVACDEVTLSGDGLTSSRGNFNTLCQTAVISSEPGSSTDPQDRGRRMRLDFGTLTNTNEVPVELIVRYRVVVLNSAANVRDAVLSNRAEWSWTGGSLPVQAAAVRVVEPALMLEKTVDPDVGLPGSIVTFSLKVSLHPDANSDAFNVVLTDPLPRGLTYVAGSLRFISGVQPTSLDDSSAPMLRVGWDVYPMNGGETLISFQAELSNTSPGDEIENQAVLAWTSLPGNYLLPQSPYNPLSNERYYDPGSNVNTYGTSARARITIPALPATGFAPRQVTVLPQQPLESRYTQTNDLVLEIPALGVRIPIVGVPIRGGQWDLTWLSNQAGYLEGTAYPTLAGNTGLTAHVYDANGQPGPFVGLHTLKWGDEILIRAGGVTYYYQVRDVRRVMPNDLSPLKHEQRDWVTLITCQGFEEQRNAYRWRVAVRAVLMKVSP